MTPEEAVQTRLRSLAAITALVSTRVYVDKAPQDPTFPFIRITLVDDTSDYHLRGESGLKRAHVQVESYAKEVSGVDPYALAAAVADAVHGAGDGTALSGWKGEIGSPVFAVARCARVERTRNYDPDERRVVRICQDYQIDYKT